MLDELSEHSGDSGGKYEAAASPPRNLLRVHDVSASRMSFQG